MALEVTPTPLKPQPTTWMVVAEDVRSACYHTSPIKFFDRDVSHHHIHSSTCKQSVHLSSFDFKIFNFNDTITFFPLNPPDQLQPASSFTSPQSPASIKRTARCHCSPCHLTAFRDNPRDSAALRGWSMGTTSRVVVLVKVLCEKVSRKSAGECNVLDYSFCERRECIRGATLFCDERRMARRDSSSCPPPSSMSSAVVLPLLFLSSRRST